MAGPSPLRKVTTPPADRPNKSTKPSKMVTLNLPSETLKRFADPTKEDETKSSSPSTTSGAAENTKSKSPSDNGSEPSTTPAPSTDPSLTPHGTKRKGAPGLNKPSGKRASGVGADGTPKPRGKPGPKKKPRLEDGTIDRSAEGVKTTFHPVAPLHKLGPKANQGAINEKLRALDRSGKPCRKWAKKGFQIKSFTGVTWELPSWRAPKKQTEDGTDSPDVVMSDSISKDNSSAVQSEKSNNGGEEANKGMDSVAGTPMTVAASA
ncbi:MAG: hypothetical protein M1834_008965 [Cirrosporium novae-zelandiae]|nr:MAG: hypothetical protein M1834_008965 [Cirrosporium novae-zelandiae]